MELSGLSNPLRGNAVVVYVVAINASLDLSNIRTQNPKNAPAETIECGGTTLSIDSDYSTPTT